MTMATATEVQNNFGKYLSIVQSGQDVLILKNGKEVARMISKEKSAQFLSDTLLGVLENNYDETKEKEERLELLWMYLSIQMLY